MIKELADAVARILGLKEEGLHEQALEAIDESLGDLLGLDLRLPRIMDANSIGEMFRDNNHLRVYLELELEEVDVLRRMNQHKSADGLTELVREVSQVCISKNGAPDPDLSEVLEKLKNG